MSAHGQQEITDPVEEMLKKTGCMELHFKVQAQSNDRCIDVTGPTLRQLLTNQEQQGHFFNMTEITPGISIFIALECIAETQDWRKCQNQVTEFRKCMNKYQERKEKGEI